ncbi:MAG: hypothetical protein BGP05_15950 [Rhizobiales bacterium 62-47]|nr:MAG: hypothetical protein BGP05_15950 [Rhizobiales bacterium 62-47]
MMACGIAAIDSNAMDQAIKRHGLVGIAAERFTAHTSHICDRRFARLRQRSRTRGTWHRQQRDAGH